MFSPPAAICLFLFLSTLSSLSIVVHSNPSGEYEDSSCNNGGNPGICKLLPECPSAQEGVRLLRRHNLKRCGFEGFTEIVCCPTSDFKASRSKYESTTTDQAWSEDSFTRRPHQKVTTPTPRMPDVTVNKPQNRNPDIVRKSAQACEKLINDVGISLSYHIVEGEIAGVGDFPHMAALGYNTSSGEIKFSCGASLISNRYIVTAAHCVTTRDKVAVVRLGQVDVPEVATALDSNDYKVEDAKVHPQYKWKEKLNDIALIRLDRKVATSNTIYPACLYLQPDDPTELLITGWGATSLGGDRSNLLQKATLTSVPLKECKSFFPTRNITETQICASDSKSDACQGDSGGPLQVQKEKNKNLIYSIVGVTSYGIGCASRYPGIYTRIHSYLDWIESVVWP